VFVVARILIGCVFVVSGFEKIISPYQNFLYVVQGYEFFLRPLEELIARFFPWGELILGVFMILGFWLEIILKILLAVVSSFIVILAQALLRKLDLTECGCFGNLLSFPLHITILFDAGLWILLMILIVVKQKTSIFGLDQHFSKKI